MQFRRTIGIDCSGAETPDSSLEGLRIYMSEAGGPATEVAPPPGSKRYWKRRTLCGWLAERMAEPVPTIAGIDHAFSFPELYFERYDLPHDRDAFLADFCAHWPTDQRDLYVDFLRHGCGTSAALRGGDSRWRRRTEELCRAKSVFHFDVQGQVAKATHAGLPFLRQIRRTLPGIHFWPFDGWQVPIGRSAVVECYPRLYNGDYSAQGQTPGQHAAFSIASWLRDADKSGLLSRALVPPLAETARRRGMYEGWILGVLTDDPEKASDGRKARPPKPRHDQGTTRSGYRNRNGQIVIRPTGRPGTDHNQQIYQLCCGHCGLNYGANGSDIHARKCPACGGGRPGLVI